MITARKPSGIEMRPGLRNSNSGFSRPDESTSSSPLNLSRLALAAATSFCDAGDRLLSLRLAPRRPRPRPDRPCSFSSRRRRAVDDLLRRRLDRPSGRSCSATPGRARSRSACRRSCPSTMPPVLQRFQYSVSSTHGKLADAATANASATRCATFCPLAAMPMAMASAPTITVAMRAALDLLLRRARARRVIDAHPQVVRHRRRRGEHEPGHHGDDRRERHRSDEREHEVAEQRVRAAARRTARAAAPPCCRRRRRA